MSRVKSLVSAGLIASALMVGTMSGASADHVNQNACFGQARSADASDPSRRPIGEIFSSRGADNAKMNAEFRVACQAE